MPSINSILNQDVKQLDAKQQTAPGEAQENTVLTPPSSFTVIGGKPNTPNPINFSTIDQKTDEYNQQQAMQQTLIQGGNTGLRPSESIKTVATGANISQDVDTHVQKNIENLTSDIKGQLASSSPEQLQQTVDESKLRLDTAKDQLGGAFKQENAVINSVKTFDLDAAKQKDLATQIAMTNDLNKILPKQGLGEKAWYFVKNNMPFILEWDTRKLVSDLTGDAPTDVTSSSATDLQKIISKWKILPPERRQAEWEDHILPAIQRNAGRNVQVITQLAQAFLGSGVGEEFQSEARLENVLSAGMFLPGLQGAEGATKSAQLVKALEGAAKESHFATNTVKITAEAGNIPEAAKIVTNIITKPTESTAKAANIDTAKAVQMAHPFNFEEDNSAVNLAGDVAKELEIFDRQESLEGAIQGLRSGSLTVENSALTEAEQSAVQIRELEQFAKEIHDKYPAYVQVEGGKLATSPTGFQVTLNVKGQGIDEALSKDIVYSRNDITSQFDVTNLTDNKSVGALQYPSYTLSKIGASNALERSFISYLNQAKVEKTLSDEFNMVFKGMNQGQIDKLSAIVDAGSKFIQPDGKIGKTFTELELEAGVSTKAGISRLSTVGEKAAYYKWRLFAKKIKMLEEDALGKDMDLKGYTKSIAIGDEGHIVRPIENPTASGMASKGELRRVYDPHTNSMVDTSPEFIKEKLDSGSQLVELHEHTSAEASGIKGIKEGERIQYALVNKTDLAPRPKKLLNDVEGYVPRITQNEEFWIKKRVGYNVNGKSATQNIAVNSFSSKIEAQKELEKLNASAMLDGKWDGKNASDAPFLMLGDREHTFTQSISDKSAGGRGIMYGHRSSQEIPYGVNGVPRTTLTLDPIEAYNRQIRQLSKYYTRNDTNMSLKKAWENTAQGYLNRPGDPDVHFGMTLDNSELGRKLEILRDKISAIAQIPSPEDNLWESAIQSMHDFALEGAKSQGWLKGKDSIPSLLWLKHTDPVNAMMSAAFHPLLGFFRPHMFFLHASQISWAMSLQNPVKAPEAFAKTMALMMADNALDRAARVKIYAKLAEVPELKYADAGTMQKIHALWEKSGYGMMAKHNESVRVLSDKIGLDRSMFQKFMSKTDVFFTQGLSFADKYTFISKVDELGGIDKFFTSDGKVNDAMLKKVISLTDRDRLHMHALDRANLDKGLIRVPLQFARVTFKAFNAVAGQEYTLAQKMRLMGSQIALFGAAGIGLQGLVDWTLRNRGLEPEVIKQSHPYLYKAATGGIVDMLPLTVGIDSDFSNKMALINGFGEWTVDKLFDNRNYNIASFGGASVSEGKTVADTMSKISKLALSNLKGAPLTKSEILEGLTLLSQTTGTGKDLLKAWYMYHDHEILSSSGIPLIEKNFSVGESLAQAAGFPPSVLRNYYNLKSFNENHQQMMSEIAKEGAVLMQYHMHFYNDNPDMKDQQSQALLKTLLHGLNENEAQSVQKNIERRIMEEGGKPQQQELKKFLKFTVPQEMTDNFLAGMQRIKDQGMIYNDDKLGGQ